MTRALLVTLAACGAAHVAPPPPPRSPAPATETRAVLPEGHVDVPLVITRAGSDQTAPAEPVFRSVHRGGFAEIAWSPRGDVLAVLGTSGVLSIVDREGRTRASRRVQVRSGVGYALHFDRTGTRLLVAWSAGSAPGGLVVWDLATGHWVVERLSRSEDFAPIADISPDGTRVYYIDAASAEATPSLRMIDIATNTERVLVEDIDWSSIQVFPSGRRIVLGSEDGFTLHDAASGEIVWSETNRGHLAAVRPTGGLFAVTHRGSPRVELYDEDGTRRGEVGVEEGTEHDAALDWTRDGSRLLLYSRIDARLRMTALETSSLTPVIGLRPFETTTTEWRYGVTLGNDAAELYVTGGDGSVRHLDMRTGEMRDLVAGLDVESIPLDPIEGMRLAHTSTALSPDGQRLAVIRDEEVQLLELPSGETRARLGSGQIENSIWGVVPTARGLLAWGRGAVEEWTGLGVTDYACAGRGTFVERAAESFWVTTRRVCKPGGVVVESEQPILGTSASAAVYATLSERAIELHDVATGRIRSSLPLPTDAQPVECFEDAEEVCLGSVLLDGAQVVGLFDGQSLFHFRGRRATKLELAEPASSVTTGGGLMLARGETTLRGFDLRGGVVRVDAAEVLDFAVDRAGRALAYVTRSHIVVLELPSGEERGRFAVDPPPTRLALYGDVLIAEQGAWNLGTAEPIAALGARGPYSVDDAGARLARCEAGELIVRALPGGGASHRLGPCSLVDAVAFVAHESAVAVLSRTEIHVVRIQDGSRLTLRVQRGEQPLRVAHDQREVWIDPATGRDSVWYRRAGSLGEAELDAVLPAQSSTLLGAYFGTAP